MRTKTLKIYKFDELSKDARARAIEHYRAHNDEIFWQQEIFESMQAVFKTANIKMLDYSLGLNSYSYVKIDLDSDAYDLTGARALAWLENNLLSKLRMTRAEYLKNRARNFRYGYRVGKIKDCPLTGYCADEDFLGALIDGIKSGDSLGDAFKLRMPETYIKILESEHEYQNSDEYISEHMIANEYEFLEDGSFYR